MKFLGNGEQIMTRNYQNQSRNMVITELMQLTGWSREKVVDNLKELERFNLVKFPKTGGIMLKEVL